jgi:hypothetical protein
MDEGGGGLQHRFGLLPLLTLDLVADARPVLEDRRLDDPQQGHVPTGGPGASAGEAERGLELRAAVRDDQEFALAARHGKGRCGAARARASQPGQKPTIRRTSAMVG